MKSHTCLVKGSEELLFRWCYCHTVSSVEIDTWSYLNCDVWCVGWLPKWTSKWSEAPTADHRTDSQWTGITWQIQCAYHRESPGKSRKHLLLVLANFIAVLELENVSSRNGKEKSFIKLESAVGHWSANSVQFEHFVIVIGDCTVYTCGFVIVRYKTDTYCIRLWCLGIKDLKSTNPRGWIFHSL